MNKKIYIMVGLPASGKSTFIEKFLDGIPISSDAYIVQKAELENKTYDEVFDQYINEAIKQTWEDFRNNISNGRDIIFDQTNLTKKKRRRILSQIPKDYEKYAIVFEVDEDVLFERLAKRSREQGKTIPRHIIRCMQRSYQPIEPSEGFDYVWTIRSN